MNQTYRYARSRAIPQRLPIGRILGLLLLLLLALPIVKLVQIGLSLQRAANAAQNFVDVAQSGLTTANLTVAQSLLQNAVHAVGEANQEMNFFRPLLTRSSGLPRYGATLAALPDLLNIADELAKLGAQGFTVAAPLLTTAQGTLPLDQLPKLLQNAQPQLQSMTQTAGALQTRLDQLAAQELRLGLAEPVANLQAVVTLLASGLHLSADLPALLGVDRPHTYLILAQNNHELRGTGGFITSVGRLTVAEGQVITLEFVDSYQVDHEDLPHPAAPPQMQRYMQIDQLLLRDVNWSPDLPTTARLAQTLYAQNTGYTVDGVITLDLHAVELFVGALEPLSVAGVEGAITQENFVARAKELWAAPAQSEATRASNDPEWWRQRKDFIPLVAKAAFARLQSGDFDYLRVAQALYDALAQRAIQLWFNNAKLSKAVEQLHWDGGLHPAAAADFLAVVESNFGYNKVNAVVERTLTYQVQWPTVGEPGIATATLAYHHPLTVPNAVCDPRPRYDLTYDEMMQRCYFAFVRLYVPEGSTLLKLEGVAPDSVISQHGEGNSQRFGGYFVLAPGAETQITFTYQLPVAIQPSDYQLMVQRQAGTAPLSFAAQVGSATLNTTIEQGWFVWQPKPNG